MTAQWPIPRYPGHACSNPVAYDPPIRILSRPPFKGLMEPADTPEYTDVLEDCQTAYSERGLVIQRLCERFGTTVEHN